MSYTDYNTSICPDGGTTTEGDLNSMHLKFCKLQVWGRCVSTPKVSPFLSSYLVLELVYVLASCYTKKMKKMRGVAMVTTLSHHQQTIMVSTLNVLLLTLNKALPGGHPRITRFVLMLISF